MSIIRFLMAASNAGLQFHFQALGSRQRKPFRVFGASELFCPGRSGITLRQLTQGLIDGLTLGLGGGLEPGRFVAR